MQGAGRGWHRHRIELLGIERASQIPTANVNIDIINTDDKVTKAINKLIKLQESAGQSQGNVIDAAPSDVEDVDVTMSPDDSDKVDKDARFPTSDEPIGDSDSL